MKKKGVVVKAADGESQLLCSPRGKLPDKVRKTSPYILQKMSTYILSRKPPQILSSPDNVEEVRRKPNAVLPERKASQETNQATNLISREGLEQERYN